MICSICRKVDVRPPNCCNKCGALACRTCLSSELPPGTWEIKYNVETGRIEVCKNCVAEMRLTEDV